MAETWAGLLARWTEAGLIDAQTADRIRAYELTQQRPATLGWSVRIALAFGALMLGAGTLLFVSANWNALSPEARFGMVTLLVAVFHIAGAALSQRFARMASALHAVGTVALGAGIYLAGQIFNLDEHWPGGLMLWALGAALGWALLKDWPQLALVAILAPAWLTSEWFVAAGADFWIGYGWNPARIAASGIFLLALAYFTAAREEGVGVRVKTLLHIGRVALIPAAFCMTAFTLEAPPPFGQAVASSAGLSAVGWAAAIGLPLGLAIVLRRAAAWPNAVAVLWVLVLVTLRPMIDGTLLYAWWALGAAALAAWGVGEARSERINMGMVIFGLTILAFYFSHVMDKLGRSASLVGFGLLFLTTGWALDRVRRRLILQTRGGAA